MQPIYIPHLLRSPNGTQQFEFQETIGNLETLTPVRGALAVRHGGTFLEITVTAETIVNLTCDRCTQSYNQRLALETEEILWLEADDNLPPKSEIELNPQDLAESLDPQGYFDLEAWIYEQLCLALPLRNLCGKACQPPEIINQAQPELVDERWAALKQLKS